MNIKRMSVWAAMAMTVVGLSGCLATNPQNPGDTSEAGFGSDRYVINGVRTIGRTNGTPVISNLNVGSLEYGNPRVRGQIVELQYGPLILQGDPSLLGVGGGAAVGGVLGNQVGKGNGRKAATVVGALVGAGVGGAISSNNNTRYVNVYKMTVRLNDGRTFRVLQADRGEDFYKGDPVSASVNRAGYWEIFR